MIRALDRFSLPLTRPLSTASGDIADREGFVVTAEAGGERGVGEATPLPGWTESLADCEAALRRAATFDDARTALDALDDGGALGDAPAARHGLSLAVLDARARTAGETLYRTLGGDRAVDSVPVNATVGDGDVEATVAAARRAVDAGFDCLKVKVGARSLAEDVDRLQAVREAFPDADLRADANGAWDCETARRAVDELASIDLAYLEQPLAGGDVDGHAALREYVAETGRSLAVAVDESLASTPSRGANAVDAVLEAAAADVLVLKPMALGGVDRARTAALDARERGVDAVVTTTVDAVYARTAAVHLAASLPDAPACGLATGNLLASDLARDPAPVERGHIAVPEGKGNVPATYTSDRA